MINSDIAYFDPNTYGENGYSFIAPLLLFYKKLVIYGPVGYFIEKSYENDELRKTSLTPDEFIEYIEKGIIVPLGFETFFNENERSRIYLPELRVITDFDKDLITSPSLSQRTFTVSNEFKHDASPREAKDIIERNPFIKNRLLAEIQQEDNLPKRYKDLKQNSELIPEHLKKIVGFTETEDLLPFVIIYDFLNNKHVMVSEGSAGVHSQHLEFKGIYRAIHGFDKNTKEESQHIEIIAEIVKTCISEISYGRLSSEQINEFRAHHKDDFIAFVEEAFVRFENVTDLLKKKENIVDTVSEKLSNMKIHLAIGPEKLIEMIPALKVLSKPISLIFNGRRGSIRNTIYHGLHQPLKPSDRWVYHFVKYKK